MGWAYWTDPWNPVVGCSPVSPACDHCWAARRASQIMSASRAMAEHYGFSIKSAEDGHPLPEWNGSIFVDWTRLDQPLRWRSPRVIFAGNMSDIFHADVPSAAIQRILDVAAEASRHTILFLTKRPERLRDESIEWSSRNGFILLPEHLWFGVTVESPDYASRIDLLDEARVYNTWLSAEPLLGDISRLDFSGFDWVTSGSESGPDPRTTDDGWIQDLHLQLLAEQIPHYIKQTGPGGRDHTRAAETFDAIPWASLLRARGVGPGSRAQSEDDPATDGRIGNPAGSPDGSEARLS